MKKRKFVLLLCLALLPGCGEEILKKPIADIFAEVAESEEPMGGVTPGISFETTAPAPAYIQTEPPSPEPAQDSDDPTSNSTPAPNSTPTPTPSPAQAYIHPPFITADSFDSSGFSNKKLGWYFMKNNEHQPTRGAAEIDISAYDGYYLGDTTEKYIWLTFDLGYENGYTASILDTLKEKNESAAFFCVGAYIRDNPELTQRMAAEGHLVVNHSDKHPSFPDISDQRILDEIYETARRYKELTGLDMPAFFRPPSGEYSERILFIAKEAGYKTIFWSFAYRDWLVDDQPGKDYAINIVLDNLHNGEILLLHAVSSSNAEALPDIIDAVKAQGYEFKSLFDLP